LVTTYHTPGSADCFTRIERHRAERAEARVRSLEAVVKVLREAAEAAKEAGR
jgi:hypothetical protein